MHLDLTTTYIGIISLIIFIIAYAIVMIEEFTHLRKSKPVIISATLIWALIAYYYSSNGIHSEELEQALERNLLEFAELFLFLLVAMTYINSLQERNVFETLRYKLMSQGFNFRQLFWLTGIITFFSISYSG